LNIAALGIGLRPVNGLTSRSYPQPLEKIVSGPVLVAKPADTSMPAAPPRAISGGAFTISVYDNVAAIAERWKAFEATAHGTLYQSSLWCRAWLETAGRARRVRPRIAVVSGPDGTIRMLFPLQVRRVFGATALEWLGSPHNNYGGGLFARNGLAEAGTWLADNWSLIVTRAGPCDTILLHDMPRRLLGLDNPLACLFNLKAPNRSYAMRLGPDFEAIYHDKRSSDDRRAARKRESGLARAGAVAFGLPAGKAELHRHLDIMFAQQEARLAERGVHGVFGPSERDFVHRLAELQDEADPVLAPYTLSCNGDVLAVMLGGVFGGSYWAMISSLAASDLRRHSPGDLALRKTIEACCRRGLAGFDFSSGQSTYKERWADEVIELHAHVSARTWRGLPVAVAVAAAAAAKRAVKETPVLLEFANRLRRMLRGRSA